MNPSVKPLQRKTAFLAMLAMFAAPVFLGVASGGPQIQGRIVDFESGRPLSGIVVVAVSENGGLDDAAAADRSSDSSATANTATTDADGSFGLPLPSGGRFLFNALGAAQSHVTFHGVFAADHVELGTLRLIAVTGDERAALAELNHFRGAPGGVGHYGAPTRLVFDENLMESARFWALQEGHAGRIGHTCGELGNPPKCVEFDAFFHALPGAPQDWSPAQNAAFTAASSWANPNMLFEIEGRRCAPAYDWHRCGYNEEVGHFVNIMSAEHWVGLGAKGQHDAGVYYAMNLI
jgi:hypothetical protein